MPLARAIGAFAGVTLAPDALADAPPPPPASEAAAEPGPVAGDGRHLPDAIELDIFHRDLVGWVAALVALQLSMEDNTVPPAAFDAVVASIRERRDEVGRALPPEYRTRH